MDPSLAPLSFCGAKAVTYEHKQPLRKEGMLLAQQLAVKFPERTQHKEVWCPVCSSAKKGSCYTGSICVVRGCANDCNDRPEGKPIQLLPCSTLWLVIMGVVQSYCFHGPASYHPEGCIEANQICETIETSYVEEACKLKIPPLNET